MTERDSHPRADTAPQRGDVAPDLELFDEAGQIHSLTQSLATGKPIVLIFMRGEW